MTIQQAQERKENLEEEIKKLVNDFMEETNAKRVKVDIRSYKVGSDDPKIKNRGYINVNL